MDEHYKSSNRGKRRRWFRRAFFWARGITTILDAIKWLIISGLIVITIATGGSVWAAVLQFIVGH